jgi:hypothetical protein
MTFLSISLVKYPTGGVGGVSAPHLKHGCAPSLARSELSSIPKYPQNPAANYYRKSYMTLLLGGYTFSSPQGDPFHPPRGDPFHP